MKSSKKFISIITLLLLAGLLLVWLLTSDKSNNRGNITYETHSGRVQKINTEAQATDGPSIYELQTDFAVIKVSVASAESACDPKAIMLPDIKMGDKAEVRGKPDKDGVIKVCGSDTYLKKL